MNSAPSVPMIGLTASGKTTYLAALWHVLQEGDVPGALKLDRFAGDDQYIHALHAAWLEGKQLARTNIGPIEHVALYLKSTDGGELSLTVPDPSGELFGHAVAEREWPLEFDEFVSSAKGVLLFIHPEGVSTPHLISEVDIGDDIESIEDPSEGDPIAWDSTMIPTQAALVEMLQFLHFRSGECERASIVISAWDLVTAIFPDITPDEWLAENLPLLHQYLDAQGDYALSTCFGISAQGGRIPEDTAQLVAVPRPSERLMVVGEYPIDRHDITAPLRWLMGQIDG